MMTHRNRSPIRLASRLFFGWAGLVVSALIAGACGSLSAPAETPTPARPFAGVTQCRRLPQFITAGDLNPNALVGTTLRGYTGFTVSEPPTAENPQGKVIQHETWDDAGNLGPFVLDRNGYIYTAPVPLTSLEINPPEEQNRIYRIHTQTGEMSLFIELPRARPLSPRNPFGVLGLAYDCETDSLYASSVAGSGPLEEVGRIYQIDIDGREVVDQLETIDAMGVGIFYGVDGKRLYYGSARAPQIFSVGVDANGRFDDGSARPELSLNEIPGLGNQRVRRIDFPGREQMQFRTADFNFSLRVTGEAEGDVVTLDYVPDEDDWMVRDVRPLALPTSSE